MALEDVHARIAALPGVVPVEAKGATSCFHNTGRALPRDTYLAMIKDDDGANDRAVRLDRPELAPERGRLAARLTLTFRYTPAAPRPGRHSRGGDETSP